MSLNRTKLSLATGLLVFLLTIPASAQIRDMEWFAQSDQGTFGGGGRASQGFFLSFEGLHWAISPPEKTEIGSDGNAELAIIGYDPPSTFFPDGRAIPIRNRNTHDTGGLISEFTWGERMELGWIQEHRGWKFGSIRLSTQTQSIYGSSVGVNFSDAPFGGEDWTMLQGYVDDAALLPVQRLAVIFDEIIATNRTEFWGVQWECIHRSHPRHNGSFWELFAGVRYMELDEVFEVDALGGILDTSYWMMDAENHAVGPQVGVRMFRTNGRWTFSTEGRFFAGFNFQNVFHRSTLGTELLPPGDVLFPLAMGPTSTTVSAHTIEFTPAVELRLDLKYKVTRAINLRVGWTGMWIDGIARPSNMFDYEVANMNINMDNNRQDVFLNGINFGFDLNY